MGSVGSAIAGVVAPTSGLSAVFDPGQVLGNDQNAGILGLGQFRGDKYNINGSAFLPNEAELAFNKELLNRMNGNGPSVAQMQMRAGADLAAQNAMGMAAASRGVNPAMAARLAQMTAAQGNQASNQQAGLLRAAEQMENAKLYGNALASQRESRMAKEQLGVQQQTGLNQVNQGGYESAAGRRGDVISGIGSALVSMSDARSKTAVRDGDTSIESFLDAVKAKSYEYKDTSNGEGRFVSPMAQDLEKTSVGKSMVLDTPNGKMVDYGKGFGAMLAAQANLNDRLSKLERTKMNEGGMVPGKAKVAGDSKTNDTVDVSLSPGEMVIPRTVVKKGPDAVKAFAEALLSKGGKNGKKAA